MTLDDFNPQILKLDDDYEGEVIATLLHSSGNKAGKASVLYLHGFNDYFFHPHVAEQFHKQGFNFYALDLRKHGRSILPHQHPNYCKSLTEFFEEIELSLRIIKEKCDDEVILLGHSNGGLIASYYIHTANHNAMVDALILNSPFLEFNLSKIQKWISIPLTLLISKLAPYASFKKPLSELYAKSVHKNFNGEWNYDFDIKPAEGFPAYFTWAQAVHRAQQIVRTKADIQIPVLVMHSSKSCRPKRWDPCLLESDMVLDVEHIKAYGPKLGKNVTLLEVKNAMHDVFLSGEKVRKKAFEAMFEWLKPMFLYDETTQHTATGS